ncbi:PDZ domain-containing protein MAGIX isoform X1 [Echinops telfairi]|uniref:PDZ domain-containing protein MAGIX isoform X1 n=1 Tax=Echinops telfairi TaxID=9371 RepID=A0ABM0J2C5_ECHTE|nr:PDZ domain-containing protein MAGIX isoform X1 [Echinops telfairi]
MEARSRGAVDPRGSTGGRSLPPRAGPSAPQFLARLDARPLAARAAADVAALVRRAGATLRLRPKEGACELDPADIEFTDSHLPHASVVGHRHKHRHSEIMGTSKMLPRVTQDKARRASKPSQTSGQFYVELIRGPSGFGLTFSGGRDVAGDVPVTVRGLLEDSPAQRCGRLQAGDLVLHINGESTNGLTKAQVMERIRSVGPRLHLVLCRPLDTQKRDLRLDPGRPEVTRSCSAGGSPRQHPESGTMTQICGSLESSSEAAVHRAGGSPTERPMEDPGNHSPSSPGPWLVPCEERLSQALRVPAGKQLALAMATGRRRH